jgi:hypothetical protein
MRVRACRSKPSARQNRIQARVGSARWHVRLHNRSEGHARVRGLSKLCHVVSQYELPNTGPLP